jgi:hypothetical protein
MLGAHALLGRTFSDEEGRSGGPKAVLLSEGLWREALGVWLPLQPTNEMLTERGYNLFLMPSLSTHLFSNGFATCPACRTRR